MTRKMLQYLLWVILMGVLGGASCSQQQQSAPPAAPAPSPRKPVASTYSLFSATLYPADPDCTGNVTHQLPDVSQKLLGSLFSDSWSGPEFDSGSMRPGQWYDNQHSLCTASPLECEDTVGADSGRLLVYLGHGAYPDIEPPVVFAVGKQPHQTLWFPYPVDYDYNDGFGPTKTCDVRLSNAGTNMFPFSQTDVWLGAGSGARASHIVFSSSCTAQPRLMDQFMLINRPSQVFGFMFSPEATAGPNNSTLVSAELLNQFFVDTLTVGNVDAWMTSVGLVTKEAGGYAGAIAHTYVSAGSAYTAESFASDGPISARAGVSRQHMLRAGQGIDRQMPQSSSTIPTYDDAINFSVKAYARAEDICFGGFGGCGNPDPNFCTSSNGQPLESVPTRFVGGTPTPGITSENTGRTGFAATVVAVRTPTPDPPAVAKALTGLAAVMTGEQFDATIAEKLVRENIKFGDWRFGELADGMFVGFDAARARVRLYTPYPEEEYNSDGTVLAISWGDFEKTVDNLLERLAEGGLPAREYWSINHPLLGTIHERLEDKSYRIWGYTYTVFRMVNGTPIRAMPLTVMVHRSGRVVYLALTGRGTDTVGPAGKEYNDRPLVEVRIPLEQAIERLQVARLARTGAPVRIVSSELLYEDAADPKVFACAENARCTLMETTYSVKFAEDLMPDAGLGPMAPPIRTGFVSATSGEVYVDE